MTQNTYSRRQGEIAAMNAINHLGRKQQRDTADLEAIQIIAEVNRQGILSRRILVGVCNVCDRIHAFESEFYSAPSRGFKTSTGTLCLPIHNCELETGTPKHSPEEVRAAWDKMVGGCRG